MAQTSFAVMTTLGRAKEAAALANATTITVTQIAIGDGPTVPSGGETALYHEVARKAITGHGTVAGAANVAYFDCYLAAGDGPYTIREAGLYDNVGDLIAIAHYDPPINKPVPSSGQTVEGTVRLEVAFSDVANVTIVVDPSMQVALQRLTRLPWIPIISMSLAAPPVAPVPGDTYLIAAAPTGAWTGQAGNIAEYTTAGWAIITPPAGHGVSLPDGRVFERVGGNYVEKIALDAQSGKWSFAAADGTANALTAVLTPAPAAYTGGLHVRLQISFTNTGAVTFNLNGLGAKPIKTQRGDDIAAGDLASLAIVDLVYDALRDCWLLMSSMKGTGPYTLRAIKKITATSTWTRPTGCRAILVEIVGGGGGGGGAPQCTSAGQLSMGSGGGAGGYARKFIEGPDASYVVTIGGGGGVAAGVEANPGGTTSWGSVLSATGGAGGTRAYSDTTADATLSVYGGAGTGGDVSGNGQPGARGQRMSGSIGWGGIGGSTIFGGGGYGSGDTFIPGGSGAGYGAGGGGAVNKQTTVGMAGGVGGNGVAIVWEFY